MRPPRRRGCARVSPPVHDDAGLCCYVTGHARFPDFVGARRRFRDRAGHGGANRRCRRSVSLLPAEPETARPLSRLAPLAADSVWTPRFEAAAGELAKALRSRDEAQWAPLLGGQWPARRRSPARQWPAPRSGLAPFSMRCFPNGSAHHAILGWNAPASLSADERTAIETGQEAEALRAAGRPGPMTKSCGRLRPPTPTTGRGALCLCADRVQHSRWQSGLAGVHRTRG